MKANSRFLSELGLVYNEDITTLVGGGGQHLAHYGAMKLKSSKHQNCEPK